MKLNNEFTVSVPIERVWETLLDIERVAGFLPGAAIEPGGEDGIHRGSMKLKVGPMTVNYQGTARLSAVDEQARTADIEVRAKEAKGQGTAAAVIHNRLISANGATRVVAETDLQVTGRQAQFGRGIMQDIAGRTLGDFAQRFERYLTEDDGGPATAATAPESEAALDLGSVLGASPYVRYGAAAAGALLAALGGVALVRRSRRSPGFSVKLDLGG